MTRWPRLLLIVALTLTALAFGAQLAVGEPEYRGSDPISNVSPGTGVKDTRALINRHPIGHYSLDVAVEIGLTNLGDVIGGSGQAMAAGLWDLTVTILNAVISLFAWAFTLDLLGARGGGTNLLAPVAEGMATIHEEILGRAWMVVAVLVMAMWAMWRALIQQRYAETAGTLATSIVFSVIALFFVAQPATAIGQVSRWTNDMSTAFLSLANSGDVADPEGDKREITDRLFESLIYDPWIALNFGGLTHCVTGKDDETRPVDCPEDWRPETPGAAATTPASGVTQIDHKYRQAGGRGGYAEAFLYYAPRTEERTTLFDNLASGEVPEEPADPPPGKAPPPPLKLDEADRPAADIGLAPLGWQRAAMAALILFGSLGAACLLGVLSLAVILAQFVALLLLMLAPVALVVGMIPGRGHAFFRAWLGKLGIALVAKAVYSLALAVVLAVAGGLLSATGNLDWLLGFVLVSAFWWGVFLYRKRIAGELQRLAQNRGGATGELGRRIAHPWSSLTRDVALVRGVRGRRRPERPDRPQAPSTAASGRRGASASTSSNGRGSSAAVPVGSGGRTGAAGAAAAGAAGGAAGATSGNGDRGSAARDRLGYLRAPGSRGTAAAGTERRLGQNGGAPVRVSRTSAPSSPSRGAGNSHQVAAAAAGGTAAGAAAGRRGRKPGTSNSSPSRSTRPPSPRTMLERDDRARAQARRSAGAAPPAPPPGATGRKVPRQAAPPAPPSAPRGQSGAGPPQRTAPRAPAKQPRGGGAPPPRPQRPAKPRAEPPARPAKQARPGRRPKRPNR